MLSGRLGGEVEFASRRWWRNERRQTGRAGEQIPDICGWTPRSAAPMEFRRIGAGLSHHAEAHVEKVDCVAGS